LSLEQSQMDLVKMAWMVHQKPGNAVIFAKLGGDG
jgi:hypothetical protein